MTMQSTPSQSTDVLVLCQAPTSASEQEVPLPKLFQHMLVKKILDDLEFNQNYDMVLHEKATFCALRICSREWRSICDDALSSIVVSAWDLVGRIPFLNRLSGLNTLIVRGLDSRSNAVDATQLSALTASLTCLNLSSSDHDPDVFSGDQNAHPAKMVDLRSLLSCWNKTLTCLDMFGCYPLAVLGRSPNLPGFWAQFPCLRELSLVDFKPTFTVFCTLDLAGCSALQKLKFSGQHIFPVDLTPCTQLTSLNCSSNKLESLDLSTCPRLIYLLCLSNRLKQLDLSFCTRLQTLSCSSNLLETLDCSPSVGLVYLNCQENPLRCLSLPACVKLQHLWCAKNGMHQLDISTCRELLDVCCSANKLTQLDLLGCDKLQHLNCSSNQLPEVCFSTCASMVSCNCNLNNLSQLDFSASTNLKTLECSQNRLVALILAPLAELKYLNCMDNERELTVTGGAQISKLKCDAGAVQSFPVSVRSHLIDVDIFQTVYACLDGFEMLRRLWISDIAISGSLDLTGCSGVEVTINGSSSGYWQLQVLFRGRDAVRKLSLMGEACLANMIGFTALEELIFAARQESMLDLSPCSMLRKLDISAPFHEADSMDFYDTNSCRPPSINLIGCTSLTRLTGMKIANILSLDLTSCLRLETLQWVGGCTQRLDLSSCPLLKQLDVSRSYKLRTLCVTGCGQLKGFAIEDCPLLNVLIGADEVCGRILQHDIHVIDANQLRNTGSIPRESMLTRYIRNGGVTRVRDQAYVQRSLGNSGGRLGRSMEGTTSAALQHFPEAVSQQRVLDYLYGGKPPPPPPSKRSPASLAYRSDANGGGNHRVRQKQHFNDKNVSSARPLQLHQSGRALAGMPRDGGVQVAATRAASLISPHRVPLAALHNVLSTTEAFANQGLGHGNQDVRYDRQGGLDNRAGHENVNVRDDPQVLGRHERNYGARGSGVGKRCWNCGKLGHRARSCKETQLV